MVKVLSTYTILVQIPQVRDNLPIVSIIGLYSSYSVLYSSQGYSVVFFLIQLITNERREMRELTEWKENKTPHFINFRILEIHKFYNLQLFYWHFLEILWLFIFLVFYLFIFWSYIFTFRIYNYILGLLSGAEFLLFTSEEIWLGDIEVPFITVLFLSLTLSFDHSSNSSYSSCSFGCLEYWKSYSCSFQSSFFHHIFWL